MTSVKAKLTVTLKADDVVVAEQDDAALWQRVLTAIQTGNNDFLQGGNGDQLKDPLATTKNPSRPDSSDPVAKLAHEIGVERAVLDGACTPTLEPPFLHLNAHCWQAMRKQLPRTGIAALSPIAAAATLLALWSRVAGLGAATQAQALTILEDVGAEDKNPSRGVKGATWLNTRGRGQIFLNPGEISDADTLARCFCTKNWADWKSRGKKE